MKAQAASPLLDVITPDGLGFQPRDIRLGETLARVLVLSAYPPRVGAAWMSRITQLPGVVASVHVTPADPAELVKQITVSIGELGSRIAMGGSPLLVQRAERALEDAQTLLRKIDQEQQQVVYLTLVLLVLAQDEDELRRRVRQVEASAAAAGMRASVALFAQEQGLRSAGPWALLDEAIRRMGGHNMPIETVAAGYPMVRSGINHGRGILLGRDQDGGIVLVDRWDTGPDSPARQGGITNANVNILGAPGGGKSFAAKLLALREYARGARLLILDPEREYRPLARALGGAWINAAGGEGRINPLEIRPLPPDTDADPDEGTSPVQGRGPLAIHMQRVVMTWLQLYLPGLDDLERATLSQAVLAAYHDYGVGWETDPATVKQWPTVADVHRHVKEAGAERLAVLLEPAVSGAESALWNGQTTLPPAGDVTVIDIRDLVDAQEHVRRAQYFTVLAWAWDLVRMGQAEGRRTVLLMDEAWLLADPQTPQAMAFLRDLSKRIRKYQGSLVVVTQNSVDFLDPAIRRYGEPVVANAATKLFFRQESRDLEALTQLFKLTEAEQALLAGAKRGEALLIAGNSRVRITTEASDVEARVIAGGGL